LLSRQPVRRADKSPLFLQVARPHNAAPPARRRTASSRGLVLVPDGYGPLIQLGIWFFLSDSHFGAQSLAQSLLVGPPFFRHARCLRPGGGCWTMARTLGIEPHRRPLLGPSRLLWGDQLATCSRGRLRTLANCSSSASFFLFVDWITADVDAMIESLMRHYGDLRLAALPEQRGEIEQLRREFARASASRKATSQAGPAAFANVKALQTHPSLPRLSKPDLAAAAKIGAPGAVCLGSLQSMRSLR
jgi:hypothetical protein